MSNDLAVPAPRSLSRPGLIIWTYALTLFLSAFLLFSVQPFFTKMMLPRLGGTPAVWSVAMVFFQAMLLLGYLYAHALIRWLSIRNSAIVHLAVMLSAVVFLPIAISAAWDTPPETGQAFWLLGLLLSSVGLPFFALSANGPLLQAWFSRSGHPQASDPYFLYGASNIGSFASLTLYIIAFEPLFTLPNQSLLWALGYGVLVAAIASCALLVRDAGQAGVTQEATNTAKRTGGRPIDWIVLGCIPSGLLVAVTAHISTDVAAAPFLWVLPLALFLLTFVFAFRTRPLISLRLQGWLVPILGAITLTLIILPISLPVWAKLTPHLVFYFFAALYCHSLLYERRPDAERLTTFYLMMSLGGVLGGIFASLAAPMAFSWIAEYPILTLAALLMPAYRMPRAQVLAALSIGAALALVAAVGILLVKAPDAAATTLAGMMVGIVFCMALLQFRYKPIYLGLAAATLPLLFAFNYANADLLRDRSFFGVSRVADRSGVNVLIHGTTLHGAEQMTDKDGAPVTGKPVPLTYYHAKGAIAATLMEAQAVGQADGRTIGVVGLGAGSMACYGQPGENWTFFEIDKSVADIARNPAYFRFLSECGPAMPVVMGDARLTLAHEADEAYDYLLIDAFSSDAIPTHLLTKEAVELYRRKLKKDGILVFHISNRYMELPTVVAALAQDIGAPVRFGDYGADDSLPYTSRAVVALMTDNQQVLSRLDADPRWSRVDPGTTAVWTDNYSNILAAIVRQLRVPEGPDQVQ